VKEVLSMKTIFQLQIYEINNWEEITLEIRSFIKQFIENGGIVLDETMLAAVAVEKKRKKTQEFDNLDVTSQQIINILEEYVKPAVAADGGNIVLILIKKDKIVKVILQESLQWLSIFNVYVKIGIENMLKSMLNDEKNQVVEQ
jgi:Fe-S cluster biogenesis protein NfuA